MTFEKLRALISNVSGVDEADIRMESVLKDDIGMCSVDMMLMVSELAETFDYDLIKKLSLSMSVEEILFVLGE